MASWWSFRVASIAAFWVVFVVAAANEADDTPLPNSTACPECAFGKWDCHKQCKPQNTLPHMDTDFTYKLEGCIEEVPAGDNIVQVDLDIECIYDFLPVTCDNMHSFRFDGIGFIGDCTPLSQSASNLVTEECSWVCKRGTAPVARCKWHFDPLDSFRVVGGDVEMCWITQSCRGQLVDGEWEGNIIAEAACRPTPFWTGNANSPVTQLSDARTRLDRSKHDHLQAVALLNAALERYNSVENASNLDELGRARIKSNETEQALAQVMSDLNGMLGLLQSGNSNASTDLATEALRVLVEQQLGALVAELSLTMTELDVSSAAHKAAEQELAVVRAELERLSNLTNTTQPAAVVLDDSREEKGMSFQERLEYERKHKELQDSRKDEETKSTVLIVIVAIILLLSCIAIAAGGYVINNLRNKPMPTEGQIASDGGVMVVGRPIGADGSSPPAPPGGKGKSAKEGFSNEPLRKAGKADGPPSPAKTAWT